MTEDQKSGADASSARHCDRSFKEVLKVFVSMMVEDIGAHYEGFTL